MGFSWTSEGEVAMKWMLVAIVLGLAPVKTDLVYDTLEHCMLAQGMVRNTWKLYVAGIAEESRREREKYAPETVCIPYAR
jgi:hypothetical protein